VSREGALVVNNLLLCAAAAAVFIGTLYPLALEAVSGAKISVGAPYFDRTFGPLMLPLLILVPAGPMLAWKRGDALAVVQRLWAAALVALAAAVLLVAIDRRGPLLAPFGIALGLWLVAGSLTELVERTRLLKGPISLAWFRFRGLPRASLGMTLAHLGLGVTVVGIVALTAWRSEVVTVMKPGDEVTVAGATVAFLGETPKTGPNYTADAGRFAISVGEKEITTLVSEKRVFQPSRQPTTEVGIHPFLTGDLYVVMGDAAPGGGRTVRIYFNPLAPLIWLGAVVMFLGGALSLTDRRYRVGAPRAARRPAAQAAE
jgi:cytochrome c-type biogenesis protein CcmF